MHGRNDEFVNAVYEIGGSLLCDGHKIHKNDVWPKFGHFVKSGGHCEVSGVCSEPM